MSIDIGKELPGTQQNPAARITIELYSAERGQAQVQVWLDPKGTLAAGRSRSAAERQGINSAILAAVNRELGDALNR